MNSLIEVVDLERTHPPPLPPSLPLYPHSKQPRKRFFFSKRASIRPSFVRASVICSRVMKSGAWGARSCWGPGWSCTTGAGNDGGGTLAAVGNHRSIASYYHLELCLWRPVRLFFFSFLFLKPCATKTLKKMQHFSFLPFVGHFVLFPYLLLIGLLRLYKAAAAGSFCKKRGGLRSKCRLLIEARSLTQVTITEFYRGKEFRPNRVKLVNDATNKDHPIGFTILALLCDSGRDH